MFYYEPTFQERGYHLLLASRHHFRFERKSLKTTHRCYNFSEKKPWPRKELETYGIWYHSFQANAIAFPKTGLHHPLAVRPQGTKPGKVPYCWPQRTAIFAARATATKILVARSQAKASNLQAATLAAVTGKSPASPKLPPRTCQQSCKGKPPGVPRPVQRKSGLALRRCSAPSSSFQPISGPAGTSLN